MSNKINCSNLPLMLTPTDLSEILGISKNNAYVLVRKNFLSECPEFIVLKLGKQYRINRQSFIEWIEQPRVINF